MLVGDGSDESESDSEGGSEELPDDHPKLIFDVMNMSPDVLQTNMINYMHELWGTWSSCPFSIILISVISFLSDRVQSYAVLGNYDHRSQPFLYC